MDKGTVKKFIDKWTDRGDEKSDTQTFWNDLISKVLEGEDIEIDYEKRVKINGNTRFIDGYLPDTKTLIEQKSADKDLSKQYLQSGGEKLSPYEQAKRYANNLPHDEHPRWIVTSNFQEIRVYDMNRPGEPPEIIYLKDLEKEYTRLGFITSKRDEHIQKELEISMQAGDIVGELYDALLKQYEAVREPTEDDLRSLNELCVRLVFCFYAEDAGLFNRNKRDMFCEYMSQYDAMSFRQELIRLFKVLNTKDEDRDPFMRPDLKAFPYVNGGLFAREDIVIPQFTDELRTLILENASLSFDWSEISPTIFGAVFESTLNPETRRQGGMHYTSIENIHKVIDPLFLNELKEELAEVKAAGSDIKVRNAARRFQDKLASLTFLDPAAGSGNFLTETFLSLRRLENEALKLILGKTWGDQVGMLLEDIQDPIKVSIDQFYGIEINDFAVSVAKTAMWIAEAQMMEKTQDILHSSLDFLPLTSNMTMIEGNALRLDWEEIVPKHRLNYIISNPPFVANSGRVSSADNKNRNKGFMDDEQKADRQLLLGNNSGVLDYVACWYKKAEEYMKTTQIKCAYVSTDSICQGKQVAPLWKDLFAAGVNINFAYRSFKWGSEASSKAMVYVVIIGFSYVDEPRKEIYTEDGLQYVSHINAYLVQGEDIFIESRKKPICDIPSMSTGNRPADGGSLIIEEKDYDAFVREEPRAKRYIKRLMGAEEFIKNKRRYCLWLVDASPDEIRNMPLVMKRLKECRDNRLDGAPDRKRLAETPHLFRETKNPKEYIIVPLTTSRNRRYVPMGFLDSSVIPTNSATIIENASIYHFGILESNVHMAWMRATCGYFGPSYRYSKDIVYNNFPWPNPTEDQKAKIEQTAQGILDARANYPDSSLADLYDELTMPMDLRKAHQENDKAVMEAYGFNWRGMTEQECVAELMKMYQELTEE